MKIRRTTYTTATSVAVICMLLRAAVGCEHGCDENEVPGLVLEILAPDRVRIPSARIEYTFEGRMFEDTCSDDTVPCWTYEVGQEPGAYEITIEAPGFEPQHVTRTLESDGCHPITQEISVILRDVSPPKRKK